MKMIAYTLAVIALAGVTPGMAANYTWTGNAADDWDNGYNWSSMSCSGGGCYPQTTDHDAQISDGGDINLVTEEIDDLEIQGDVDFAGSSDTLTVDSITIVGGASADTVVTITGATIQTD